MKLNIFNQSFFKHQRNIDNAVSVISIRMDEKIFWVDFNYHFEMEESKSVLEREWATIYSSKDAKFVLVGNVEGYKTRLEGSHVIALNRTYSRKESILVKKAREGKTVFLGFDSALPNYSNVSNREVLFHVNLDEEEIITKENTYKITENFFDKEGEEDEIEGHAHPVIINTTPLCPNHSILVMYPDEELPQIIGQDIVLLLLNLFKLFPNLKIGYNSIGAGAYVNHLHFHLVFGEDLVNGPLLPIEKEKTTFWMKTSLINPKEEINLYSVGVSIEELNGPMGQGLLLAPVGDNLEPCEVASSLSFVFGIVANQLIQLCIPHNVIFTANGQKIYVLIREFADPKNPYSWLEYSGVIPVDREAQFGIKEEEILKVKKSLRVDSKLMQALKKSIAKNLETFI